MPIDLVCEDIITVSIYNFFYKNILARVKSVSNTYSTYSYMLPKILTNKNEQSIKNKKTKQKRCTRP